jgi:serine/threonine protein kinase
VKIIQASKIAELEYRSSVLREMAVLQLLSHPGVARLISAFRYSDSAYLVLEYAARGDLHTHVMKYGKLEHKYCRYGLRHFVRGTSISTTFPLHTQVCTGRSGGCNSFPA